MYRPPHPAGQAYCRISAGMGRAQDATVLCDCSRACRRSDTQPCAGSRLVALRPLCQEGTPRTSKEVEIPAKLLQAIESEDASETRERCAGSPWPTGTRLMLRMALRTNLPHAQGQICRLPRGSRVATRWHTRLDGRAPSSPTLAGWQGTADGKPLCAVCKSIRRAARSWCVLCERVYGVRREAGVCLCYV